MAALVPIKVGGYAFEDPVTDTEMNLINDQIVKAPNWVDGGATYTFTGEIIVAGAGLRFNSTTDFSSGSVTAFESGSTVNVAGEMNVTTDGAVEVNGDGTVSFNDDSILAMKDGSQFTAAAGVLATVLGTWNFNTGSILSINSGATIRVLSGAAFTGASGSTSTWNSGSSTVFAGTNTFSGTTNFSGATTFTAGTWPKLSSRSWTRRSLNICNVSYGNHASAGPTDADAWLRSSTSTSTNPPFIQTATETAAGSFHWIELKDLPDGSTVTQVAVTTTGNLSNTSLTLPSYRIIRWQGGSAPDNMSSLTADGHVSADWLSGPLSTTITINANSVIDKTYRYALIVNHPSASGGGTFMTITECSASGTATELRLN